MKTKNTSIIALVFCAFFFSACSFSFSTANLGDLKFGKNETANPAATSFNTGEKIYAVTDVANAMGKYKVKFNLTYENVAGKGKGESAAKKDIDIDGSSEVFFNFSSPLPGDYKVEASLVDEQGKELGKKSGTVTLKGTAPTAPADSKTDDADDKSEDN